MTYKVTVTEDVTSVSVSGNTTSINLTGEQTEISVVNPATSVTFNPSQSFSSTNVQDALFEAHKMTGEQSNNYSVILDFGNKFEIQSGSEFARFEASAGAGGFVAGLRSSDKITFSADGNLNASLDNSGSTFYDKLVVEGNPSIDDGLIQTNNTSGTQQHHIEMQNSGSAVGFLGSNGDSALLGIGSASVAVSSAGFFGGDLSPATQFGANRNGAIDLGKTNSRFRDLYLSDNLYADGVSFEDANITFTTDQFTVNNASGNGLIITDANSVALKYNGFTKLQSTNSGVAVSGTTQTTSLSVSGGSFVSTSTMDSYGDIITYEGADVTVDGVVNCETFQKADADVVVQSTSGKVEIKGTASNGSTYTNFSAEGNIAVMKTGSSGSVTCAAAGVSINGFFHSATGIVFGGAANGANHLQDYEEGTWTPTLTSGNSFSLSSNASYIKIGNLVNVTAELILINTNNATTGSLILGGLPFQPNQKYPCIVTDSTIFTGFNGIVSGITNNSDSTISFRQSKHSDVVNQTNLVVTSTGKMIFQCSYKTDS